MEQNGDSSNAPISYTVPDTQLPDNHNRIPSGSNLAIADNGFQRSTSAQPLSNAPSRQPSMSNLNPNQPPQIFGAYNADGSPTVPDIDASGMFTDTTALLDGLDAESNEAKRRRIARACDMCRKKKIKCDGLLPKCTHCTNYKTDCVFTQVEKKRNPPKGAKYIEGLENRLGRMENLLRLSGLLTEEEGGKTDLGMLEQRLRRESERRSQSVQGGSMPASPRQRQGSSVRDTPGGEEESTHGSQQQTAVNRQGPESERRTGEKAPKEVEALSDMMCSLVTNNQGETKYIGSSSGFSIFSPKGVQWVSEKTGDRSFEEMIQRGTIDDSKWVYWKPEIFGDIFERRIYQQLPPKHETLSLLKDYFENFNCMFPLFHQPTFMHLVDRQYSSEPYDGSGWWASLNVALAIAHRLRVMSNLVSQDEDQKAWGYLKNAMAVFTELTMRNTDLLSVQALLGMSLFLQGTPNPQPSFLLVAAAIRLSHSIGLHKRGSGFNLNPMEVEQRKRVFWIGYMLDKDLCLRSGRPPAQDDDDMNVELPSADPEDNIGNIPLSDGKGKVNLFRLMCEFATIESKVYKQLYSTAASKQSDGELLNTIGNLDRLLEEWKDSIPVEFRPEEGREIKASHTPLILHVVVLHFAYYNCLTTIHRMAVHHGYWTSRLSDFAIRGLNAQPLNPRVFNSAALCVNAARASIHLIKYVPQGDYSCVWLILYFPVSALMTLFGNILQNPHDPKARSDVKLMNLVVTFLSMLINEEESAAVRRMLSVCSEFERITRAVLDRADKESRKRRRANGDTEILPTFSVRRPEVPQTPGRGVRPMFPFGNSPAYNQGNVSVGQSPGTNTFTIPTSGASTRSTPQTTSPTMGNGDLSANIPFDPSWMQENLSALGAEFNVDINNGFNSFQDVNRIVQEGTGNYQPPFVPNDLWQMPMSMSMDWDWSDMTGGGYQGIENGNFDSVMPGQQHNMGGMTGMGGMDGQQQ